MHLFALVFVSCASTRPPPRLPPPEPVVQPSLPPEPVWPQVVDEVTLVAVGDLLMHTNVKRSAAAVDVRDAEGLSTNFDGFRLLFEEVDHVIEQADFAFANLETPVAPASNEGTRSMVFNVSPTLLPALRDTGFDVVSFANNHVYDQGRDGFLETMEQLDAAELPFVGAGATCADARRAKLFDVGEVRVAIIGSTLLYNVDLNRGDDDPCAFTLDAELALQEARAVRRAGADLVILSVHWGEEYETMPRPEHVTLAHELVEGGVDVIWGHHAHVVQPVEVVHTDDGRQAVIAYSLGNFISNQAYDYHFGVSSADHGNPRDGLLLRLTAVKTDLGPGPDGSHHVVTSVSLVESIAVWTDNSARRALEAEPRIRTVVLDEALDAATLEREALGPEDNTTEADSRLALLQLRRSQVDAILATQVDSPP